MGYATIFEFSQWCDGGLVFASRETVLPFVPHAGLGVEIEGVVYGVENVKWMDADKLFVVTLCTDYWLLTPITCAECAAEIRNHGWQIDDVIGDDQ